MRHYGLIGEKLGHSLSVPIHQAMFERLGIEADYRLIQIPADSFEEEAGRLLTELDGFNVTIPYKRRIMPLLEEIDPVAREMNAVNTVTCSPVPAGANTDAPGFAAMLRYHGLDPAGAPCWVLGTGGASGAVAAALRGMGAASVTLVSRHPEGDQADYGTLAREFSGLLVNATPAGMWPRTEDCPLSPELRERLLVPGRCLGVSDVIYNPAETVLTAAARARGIPAHTGLYMLVAQAVEAERRWQSCPIPQDMASTLMKELKLL